MEKELNIAIVHNLKNIEFFTIKITENKKDLIIARLIIEYDKIIDILKNLKKQGKIKSIFKPKNFTLTKELKTLIRAKRLIKKNILILKQ